MPTRSGHPLRLVSSIFLLAAVLAVVGCASIRKVTYPSDFVYLTREDVAGGMHRIAGHMGSLQDLLDDLAGGADERLVAERMMDHVDSIETIAGELGEGSAGTNHLLIDAHLDDFVATLQTARLTLAASPPRFYETGRLVGGCAACHRFR